MKPSKIEILEFIESELKDNLRIYSGYRNINTSKISWLNLSIKLVKNEILTEYSTDHLEFWKQCGLYISKTFANRPEIKEANITMGRTHIETGFEKFGNHLRFF